jgi:hypothetical protein
MRTIDLVRELESTLSGRMRELISGKLGLAPDTIGRVVTYAAPALVCTLMIAGATRHGAPCVLAAVVAPASDARIVDRLHDRLMTTAGLHEVEVMGQAFARACFSITMGELSDFVAAQARVPAQSAFALTAAMAGTLAGLLKQHVLVEELMPGDLTQLLAEQFPFIETWLTDRFAKVLRLESVAEFRDAIPAQLRVLAGSQHREPMRLPSTGEPADSVPQSSTVALMDDRAGSATVRWLVALACLVTVAAAAGALLIPELRPRHSAGQHTVMTHESAGAVSSHRASSPDAAQLDAHVAVGDVVPATVAAAPVPAPALLTASAASVPAVTALRRRPRTSRTPEIICEGVAGQPSIKCVTVNHALDARKRRGARN